jgi:hypothetical protein
MAKRSRWWVACLALITAVLWANSALAMLAEPKDINEDGYDDVAAVYKYGSNKVGFWSFDSSAPTTESAQVTPRLLWKSAAGWGNASKITPLMADVTADAHADVISAYAFSSGQMGLYVTPGSAGPSTTSLWWKSSKHGWAPGNTKLTTSRAFTGFGPRNPVALYKSNKRAQLWVFTENTPTSFLPVKVWQSAKNAWALKKSKIVGGDFNHDGKGDVAILYNYGHKTSGIWTFISNGTTYTKHKAWKSAKGKFNWDKSKLMAADVDGDSIDEVVVAYQVSGQTAMRVFQPDVTGAVLTREDWGKTYGFVSTLPVTLADVNHDHKADIVVFGPGTEDMGASWDMLPSHGTSFEHEMLYNLWESAPGAWRFNKAKLIR